MSRPRDKVKFYVLLVIRFKYFVYIDYIDVNEAYVIKKDETTCQNINSSDFFGQRIRVPEHVDRYRINSGCSPGLPYA